MYGSTINKLNVYMKPRRGPMTTLWTKSGEQGNRWIKASVNLVSSVSYQIVIEAVAGTSFTGDIALDDITLTNCPPAPTPTPTPPCSQSLGPGDCDFEQDSCRCCCWQNFFFGDHNHWQRGRGTAQLHGFGPGYDHTYGNSSGHYMYVEATTASQGFFSGAEMISRKLKAVPKAGICYVNIWYHMYGRNVGNLYLWKRSSGAFTWQYPRLFYKSGDQGDQWLNATLDLYTTNYANSDFDVSIEAAFLYSANSDIAIDDISFSSGCVFADRNQCDNAAVCTSINATNYCGLPSASRVVSGDCNFECGACFWNNTDCDNFDWLVNEGGTTTFGTGPTLDHTFGTKEGHYLYIESGDFFNARGKGDRAILESPNIQGSSQSCTMTFFYHMYGSHIGSLLIYLRSSNTFQLMKNITGDQGNVWNKDNVTFVSLQDYRVHLIAVYGNGYQGDIAIDDISFKGCRFTDRKDNTYCGQSRTTGCADGSREGFFNEQFVAGCLGTWGGLRSLRNPPTGNKCGNKFDDGRSVTCMVPGDICDTKNGWHICGSTGKPSEVTTYINGGLCATAAYGRFSAGISYCTSSACNFPQTTTDYGCKHYDLRCNEPLCCGLECELGGTCTGGFWPRTTAHTPLTAYKGCSRLTSTDAGGVMCCYDPNYIPPTKPPGLCSTCNFDSDMCGFINEDKDEFDWTRRTGASGSFNTGPSNDHTTGTSLGYYMYVETSIFGATRGDVAILTSPEYNVTELNCTFCMLEFWYHMYGATIDRLEVFVEQTFDKVPLQRLPVFSLFGNQGDQWRRAAIEPLDITSPTFHIVFLATYGGSFTGDIAIDDVMLKGCEYTNAPLTTLPTTTTPTCSPSQWQCSNDFSCIDNAKLCDGSNDCTDGSDENDPNPCKLCRPYWCVNNGSCSIKAGQETCACPYPYYGNRCQLTRPRTYAPTTLSLTTQLASSQAATTAKTRPVPQVTTKSSTSEAVISTQIRVTTQSPFSSTAPTFEARKTAEVTTTSFVNSQPVSVTTQSATTAQETTTVLATEATPVSTSERAVTPAQTEEPTPSVSVTTQSFTTAQKATTVSTTQRTSSSTGSTSEKAVTQAQTEEPTSSVFGTTQLATTAQETTTVLATEATSVSTSERAVTPALTEELTPSVSVATTVSTTQRTFPSTGSTSEKAVTQAQTEEPTSSVFVTTQSATIAQEATTISTTQRAPTTRLPTGSTSEKAVTQAQTEEPNPSVSVTTRTTATAQETTAVSATQKTPTARRLSTVSTSEKTLTQAQTEEPNPSVSETTPTKATAQEATTLLTTQRTPTTIAVVRTENNSTRAVTGTTRKTTANSSGQNATSSQNPQVIATQTVFTTDELNSAVDLVLNVSFGTFNKMEFEDFMSRTLRAQVFVTSYSEKGVQSGGVAELTIVLFVKDKLGILVSQPSAILIIKQHKEDIVSKYGSIFRVRAHGLSVHVATSSRKSEGLSAGVVAGIVVGVLVIVTLVVVGLLYFKHKRTGKYQVGKSEVHFENPIYESL